MRYRVLVSLFILVPGIVLSQKRVNPYYDALVISKYVRGRYLIVTKDNSAVILPILASYANLKDSAGFEDIKLYYDPDSDEPVDPNPFIDFPGNIRSDQVKGTFPAAFTGIPSIGGLDVTNIADGLAKFMVKRTKQELNSYFFEEFASKVENSIELQILFPQTSGLLSAIGSEIYNYNAYITGLRESFESDLSNLYSSLPLLIDDKKYQHVFDSLPSVRYIIKSSLHLIKQLNSNVHPGDILHQYPRQFGIDEAPLNLYNGIRVIDLFSQSLRSKSEDRYWISQDSLSMITERNALRIYLGLIYQLADTDMVFITGRDSTVNFKEQLRLLGEETTNAAKVFKQYSDFILEFGVRIESTDLALKKLETGKSENPEAKEIYSFIQSSLSLISFSGQIRYLPYLCDSVGNDETFFDLTSQFVKIADQGANLYLNLNDRNYATAIVNLLQIFDYGFTDSVLDKAHRTSVLYEDIKKSEERIKSLQKNTDPNISEADKKEIVKLHESVKMLIKDYENKRTEVKRISQNIRKYGSFMAAVVNAGNSEDVQAIIESVALPAGSYRIKRESKTNVSLNSYLGFFGGYEIIRNVPLTSKSPNNYALSAPVGVSLTHGGIKKNNSQRRNASNGSGIGGFVSLIDIGALTSFRFLDSTSQVASKVELKNIFAPGIFFSYNFRKSPITLHAGVQMGPLLREVNSVNFKANDNYYWRYGCSLVVDIPLLNLYNRLE